MFLGINEVIRERVIKKEEIKNLLKYYKDKIYIYGAGNVGKSICEKLCACEYEVSGFIDRDEAISEYCGYPVIHVGDLNDSFQDSLVIISLFNMKDFNSIKKTLRNYSLQHIYAFTEFRAYKEFFQSTEPILSGLGIDLVEIDKHKADIIGIYKILQDDISKQCYEELFKFFLKEDIVDFSVSDARKQYFDYEIYKKIENERFVDCGAFIGDTLEIFLENNRNIFDQYYAVEPDKRNAQKIREYVKDINKEAKVKVIPCAVGNKTEKVKFMSFGTSYSKLQATFCQGQRLNLMDGSNNVHSLVEDIIPIAMLDEELKDQKITFLKMDIEGYEMKALEGAKTIIQTNKPILAICIYHKDSDLWEIPMFIKSISDEYNFYLRNYDGMIEYVLYAIPRDRLVNNVN
jgi:FkbM family methyltransferase